MGPAVKELGYLVIGSFGYLVVWLFGYLYSFKSALPRSLPANVTINNQGKIRVTIRAKYEALNRQMTK
jgi:hypothetical protein